MTDLSGLTKMTMLNQADPPAARLVSFIVPAWNEEAVLGRTLDALKAALVELSAPHEIIVVDDASTDRTAQVAQERGAHVVQVNHRQIAATRNTGARHARGDLFVFVDADTKVNAAVVQAALQAVQDGAVGGGCLVTFDEPLPFWIRILVPLSHVVRRRIRVASGCFLFCTRKAFDAVGGFDAELYAAEEVFLSRALKRLGRFVIVRAPVVTSGRKVRTHSVWATLGTLLRITIKGPSSLRNRRGLDLWYGPRRSDPGGRS